MRRSGASSGAGGVCSGNKAVGLGKGRSSREYSMAPAARPMITIAVASERESLRTWRPAEPLVTDVPAEGAPAATEDVLPAALSCTCEQPAASAATKIAAKVFTGLRPRFSQAFGQGFHRLILGVACTFEPVLDRGPLRCFGRRFDEDRFAAGAVELAERGVETLGVGGGVARHAEPVVDALIGA